MTMLLILHELTKTCKTLIISAKVPSLLTDNRIILIVVLLVGAVYSFRKSTLAGIIDKDWRYSVYPGFEFPEIP